MSSGKTPRARRALLARIPSERRSVQFDNRNDQVPMEMGEGKRRDLT
jgi:hypothetical protein